MVGTNRGKVGFRHSYIACWDHQLRVATPLRVQSEFHGHLQRAEAAQAEEARLTLAFVSSRKKKQKQKSRGRGGSVCVRSKRASLKRRHEIRIQAWGLPFVSVGSFVQFWVMLGTISPLCEEDSGFGAAKCDLLRQGPPHHACIVSLTA